MIQVNAVTIDAGSSGCGVVSGPEPELGSRAAAIISRARSTALRGTRITPARGPIPQRIVTAFGNRVNSAAFEKRDQYFSFRTRFERRERNEFDAVLCCKRVVPHGAPPPIGHPARVYAGFASALARL